MNEQGIPPTDHPIISNSQSDVASQSQVPANPKSLTVALSPQKKRLVLLGLGLLLILTVSLLGIALIGNDTSQPVSNIVQTATVRTTPTPTNIPASAAPYGSMPNLFMTAYGKPDVTSVEVTSYTVTIQQVKLRLAIMFVMGKDNHSHAATLKLTPTDMLWNGKTAGTIIATFLPSDAVYMKDVQQAGITYHIFHSDMLAQMLPASAFVTISRATSQPGNFVVFCDPDLRYCMLDTKVPG